MADALLLTACSDASIPPLALTPALGGATFERPVEVGAYVDGRVFVAERGGGVWLAGEDGARAPLADFGPLVDAEVGEGLLSVALDPAFEANGRLWAYYFAARDPMRTVLSRFEVRDDSAVLETELVVIEFAQPGYNQNGGAIRFDTEGYLYLSLGDGSASTDPFEQGQDRTSLLAKVIRIDVRESSPSAPYHVPADNPFVDDPTTRDEIYAVGFRNPFRMAIDAATGDIWLGDVGVSSAEEVNRVEAGRNYGWSILEGDRCLAPRDCPREGLEPPVHVYAHEEGRCGVIGGVVYRGEAVPALDGAYLFGDLCTGEIWALDAGSRDDTPSLIADLDGMLVTFGVDTQGEVLVADYEGGGVYRLVPAADPNTAP